MDRSRRGPAGPALASGTPVTVDPGTAKITEARDLFLSFGDTPALRGASLGVRQGEIVAVMGPSGSGKSTLLHCLAGILVPQEGQVWYGPSSPSSPGMPSAPCGRPPARRHLAPRDQLVDPAGE